ncbi:ABC transporter permease [Nonomuraea sp. NPDC005692]|uniref:ABC transporter permease n=1 Tax=Nonomuraea sp. NPDC005692 TaxID=3157168 RepID=UPI0033C1E97B
MIWLTWRQFRAAAAMTAGALAVLAAVLAATGPGLARAHSTGLAACAANGDCGRFLDRFFDEHQMSFLAVTLVVLLLPALVGLFWGAPLITRELEAGTHLLVWNQSITRTRWLAVKLALTGLASVAAAGLCSLVVTWWSGPLDRSAAPGFGLMDPLVFGARGVVPMGYAAFAFVLGVTVGMLVRRTLPAMAVTLAVFVALQLAVPLLVRPHLQPPVSASYELGRDNVDDFLVPRGGAGAHVMLAPAVPGHPGAWVLSGELVDGSGRGLGDEGDGTVVRVSLTSGPCGPSAMREQAEGAMRACLAEVNRLGYRQRAVYQPLERFWPFQWIETGLYALLALGLTAFCLGRLGRRPS